MKSYVEYNVKLNCACCNKEKEFNLKSDQWYEVPICEECEEKIYGLQNQTVENEVTYDNF